VSGPRKHLSEMVDGAGWAHLMTSQALGQGLREGTGRSRASEMDVIFAVVLGVGGEVVAAGGEHLIADHELQVHEIVGPVLV
jgi:hypothetical protein